MGNYIEFGQFKSVRSRIGTKRSKTLRNKNKESELKSTAIHTQLQTTESQRKAEQVVNDIIAAVTAAIEHAIDRATRLMSAEFPHERNVYVLLSPLLFKY